MSRGSVTVQPVIMLHRPFARKHRPGPSSAPELARTHRVILFDLRGHGLSARAKSGYDVERLTSNLESVDLSQLTDEPRFAGRTQL